MDLNGSSKVAYTAAVLDEKSINFLKNNLQIPDYWTVYCHHFTINLGVANNAIKNMIGSNVILDVVAIGKNEKVMAVKIETVISSANAIKHITVAVNKNAGGKPVYSNQITNWVPIDPFSLIGKIAECDSQGNIIN